MDYHLVLGYTYKTLKNALFDIWGWVEHMAYSVHCIPSIRDGYVTAFAIFFT
jgi:hypothetical protein